MTSYNHELAHVSCDQLLPFVTRYYTVSKKDTTKFHKESAGKKVKDHDNVKEAVEKAATFLDRDELPPHWDR